MTARRADRGVYLHIGVPKTGTTYLQNLLWENRKRLEQQGVRYAADSRGHHFMAAVELVGGQFAGQQIEGVDGSWARVRQLVADWPGPTVVSHEMMCGLPPDRVEHVCGSFGDRPVHVIVTARDLARVIPAVWQERTKNRNNQTWPVFMGKVRVGKGEGKRDPSFWRQQDLTRIVTKYAEWVPPERIHVVTVPPPGSSRTLLVERFCSVLGLDPQQLELDVKVANESIGAAEVAFLQRFNQAAEDRISWARHHDVVKHRLVPRLLATRKSPRLVLSDEELPWLRQETDRNRATIREQGLDVVGDLDDLGPRTAGESYVDPTAVDADQVLDVAVDFAVGTVQALIRAQRMQSPVINALPQSGQRRLTSLVERSRDWVVRHPTVRRLARRLRGDRGR